MNLVDRTHCEPCWCFRTHCGVRGQASCEAWVWTVVCSQVTGPSSSWQRPFCLMCFLRGGVDILHQPGSSKTSGKQRLQFVWLCQPSMIQGPLGLSGLCCPFCPILQLASFFFAITSSCLMYSFPKSPSAIPRMAHVFTECPRLN